MFDWFDPIDDFSNLFQFLLENPCSKSNEIIVEELLHGDEISIHAFTDGKNVKLLPPSQDHKQLLQNDQGICFFINWINKII